MGLGYGATAVSAAITCTIGWVVASWKAAETVLQAAADAAIVCGAIRNPFVPPSPGPACPVPLPPVAPDSDYAAIVAGVPSGVIGGFLLGAAFLHCALPPAAPSRSRTTSAARFPGVRESVSDLVLVSGCDL